MRMDKNECEATGKIWVRSFTRDDGTRVRGYCKDAPSNLPMKSDIFPVKDFEMDEDLPVPKSTHDPLASMNVKLPKSNTTNARKTYGEIKNEEKHLGKDLRTQDFEDAVAQSKRISQSSEREMNESDKLSASQAIKAQEMYAEQKRKIAKREYSETKKRIRSESKSTKHQIRSEHKRIRHQKKQARREKKLEDLKGK